MSGHTPGKWTVCGVGQERPGIESEPCSIIIFGNADEECGVHGRSHEEAVANAHLIAAAPDLLASLQEIVEEWGYPNTPKWHRARAAIAKAEGK